MNIGSVDRMSYWCPIPLLIDGIRRRENAVVHCAGFSNQADSFALGLWDKSDNLAHVRLQLQCRVSAAAWHGDGAKRLSQQPGKSEGFLPNRGKLGPSADVPVGLKQRANNHCDNDRTSLIRSNRNPPPWRSASRPMCAGRYRAGPWSEPPAPASRRSAHGRA
jgi:hypothetical protein